jgi:hypothetical protein
VNTQFLSKGVKKHERKASWVVIASGLIGLVTEIVQSHSGRSALWEVIRADEQRITVLEKQVAHDEGLNEGKNRNDESKYFTP